MNNPFSAGSRPFSLGWLSPGLGIKRWGVLTLLGIVLVVLGAALAFAYRALDFSLSVVAFLETLSGRFLDTEVLGVMLLAMGVVAIVFGVRGVFQAVERVYEKETHRDFLDVARSRKKLDSAERVVALGGGTGLSTMLRGLKEHSSNITAIVTMADDGGSTGKLREHGMLPPGDLRNCIAALAEAEPLMTELFQYRFKGLGELKGHSLGNLFMAAMFEKTGDFGLAVREVSKVLAIRGSVLPSTLDDVRMGAELQDGSEILGQVNVNQAANIARVFLVPDNPRALPGAVQAIHDAEVIIIGPGSLFTSIIPNLLVPEIAEAIKKTDVPKIYVCNVMTQPEETCGYSAADHVRAIIRHIGPGVVTHVLLNSAKVPDEVLARYSAIGSEYIVPDETEIEMMDVRAIHGPFIDVSNVVRHHPGKLAAAIFRIAARV